MMFRKFLLLLLFKIFLFAMQVDLKQTSLINQSAYISSQCYTKTEDSTNKNLLHNPCYTCHTKNKEPNFTYADDDLQEVYDFPASALKNPWINLFEDRTKEVSQISDAEILHYIDQDNYKKNNQIILTQKLKNIPKNWDYNDNEKWDGYIPDCYFDFDSEGFDKDPNGSYTLWRSFAYRPFLGTFWPTNGSTDDVIIRLDKVFSEDKNGNFDLEIYKLNLSIVEALIKQEDLQINPIDEKKYGYDMNQNGKFDIANKIVFKWKQPIYNSDTFLISDFSMTYVGKAKELLEKNKYMIAPGLYPLGTEFLHSVRYIGIENDKVVMSNRMKELRYGKKVKWNSYSALKNLGLSKLKAKDATPDKLDTFLGNVEIGLYNALGWRYQGFIEDENGDLRPQSVEETVFCMGCHNNIGAIADSTFVFQRKLGYEHFQNGWYHWTQKGLQGIKDKLLKNGNTEYVQYLKLNNAGDEFRQNDEVIKKFFVKNWKNSEQKLQKDEVAKIKEDISYLILPSVHRAMQLNKAYKVIVDEQSYIYGRDAHIKPLTNVHKELYSGQSTRLEKISNASEIQ